MLSFKIFVDGTFVNPENLDCCYFVSFGEESFETNFIVVVFRLCHGRLYFDGMPLIDLWLVNLDSSCNLVKLLRALNKSLYR